MELIHYTNDGRQCMNVKEPQHYDEILGRVALTRNATQELPHSAIHSILRGELSIGEVASVMHAVMDRSPIIAKALTRAVAESNGYAASYPSHQCPRVWLIDAADAVTPSFLAARSWTYIDGEMVLCNWWADKPNTISLLTPPADAAAILSSMDDTKGGQLAMLIDLYRDAPEFATNVAACMSLDWPALLDRAYADRYTHEALSLADTHGFLPGVYTFCATACMDYWRDFARWAVTHPGVEVRLARAGTNLYNGHPLTDTAEAILAAFERALGY